MQQSDRKFIPEDYISYLRDDELNILNNARRFLSIKNPSRYEREVLVVDMTKSADDLTDLIARFKLLLLKQTIIVKRMELLRGDSSLKKEDRLYSLLNDDSQFLDCYTLQEKLNIIIEYFSELVWSLRNLIKFYTNYSMGD